MDKFCSQCGTAITGNFCANCGAKLLTPSVIESTGQTIAQTPQATGLAIASLIMSFFLPPAGFIMGIIARNEIANARGEKGGEGLAWAAIIVSSIIFVFWVVVIAVLMYESTNGYY